MKRNYLIGAMIALLSVACSKEQPEQSVPAEVQGLSVSASVEQPGDGTKTSLDGLNVKWSVGDRIYLTDGTQTAIYKAVNASATTSFEYVSGATTLEGDVYAYYPAENVTGFNDGAFTATIPAVQPYVAGGFADGINPMTAKATVEEGSLTLNFKNVMSFVKLQIVDSEADGTFITGLSLESPSANLCGTASVSVSNNGTPSMTIAEGSGSKNVELSFVDAIGLSMLNTAFFIAVPAGNLSTLTITAQTIGSSGRYSMTKQATTALTADRSSINSYDPIQISSFGNPIALSEECANCYMIDASRQQSIVIPLSQAIAGWNAIKTLEPGNDFDTAKITSGERTIAVRWLDGANGNISLSNINATDMTLALDCSNGNNAVVDLKNGSEIVWSWHLWFTDYKPATDMDNTLNGQVHTYPGLAFQEGGKYYGKVIMDRNLGATVTGVSGAIVQPTSKNEALTYYGLYYEFGRKDPFPTNGTIESFDASENKVTYAQAVQTPNIFYHINVKTPKEGGTWCQTDLDSEKPTDPWNSKGEKSAFDPCPNGWRIPNLSETKKENVFNGLTNDSFLEASISYCRGNLWNGNVWIPLSGVIDSNGLYTKKGTSCQMWGAAPQNNVSGTWMRSQSDGVNTCFGGWGARALGMTVRCVQE